MGNCFNRTYEIPITSGPVKPPPPPPPAASLPKRDPSKPKQALSSILRAPSSAKIGPVLGNPMVDVTSLYALDKELGRGQFGVTYLCTEKSTGRKYACKTVSKRKLVTKRDMEDMRREVMILQHLTGQPNIVEFKGAYEDKDSVHLVMELCSGGELFDRITAKGSYSEKQAAAVCRDIVNVVNVCHFMGVMHRDLKPENFLLVSEDENAELKATDFGLSVFIEEGKVYKDVVGSAYYIAPEVLQKNYGKEIDVWSAGVILYILLSEEDLKGLQHMFKNIDTDQSGTITLEELKTGLRRLGSKLTEDEIKQLMDAVRLQCCNVDKNGTIDYIEFITATMHRHKLEKEEHLLKAFEHFDKDHSG
ncbi:hypothetical protein BHE74_00054936 [Ensete ventricosum]|nr:hypothetical protein BHE74_00054936 [Ensete ventricosum]